MHIPYPLQRNVNMWKTQVPLLYNNGYHPVASGLGESGKGWVTPFPKLGDPLSDFIDYFADIPYAGLSICLSPYYSNPVIAIDIDRDDHTLYELLPYIFDISECPVKRGRHGWTLFLQYGATRNLRQVLTSLGLELPSKANKSFRVNANKMVRTYSKDDVFCIDIIGFSHHHTVVPPTIHRQLSEEAGETREYEWVPLTPRAATLSLYDTPARDLPMVQAHHLALLYLFMKNPGACLFTQFLGATSPGDFYQSMLSATYYLHHEGMSHDAITLICEEESLRSSPDDSKTKERSKQIATSLRSLENEQPKPSSPKNKAPQDKQVPQEIMYRDWLLERYSQEGLARMDGAFMAWCDGKWHRLDDPRDTIDVFSGLCAAIQNQFPLATMVHITHAIRGFIRRIPVVTPHPNPHLIAFKNGVLDILTGELRPPELTDYIPHSLDVEFDPQATCPEWNSHLQRLMKPPAEYNDHPDCAQDHQRAIDCFEEYLGMCLVRTHKYRKMLVLVGAPHTGKSEVFKFLSATFPRNGISDVGLDRLDTPNSIRLMQSAYINISGEVGRHDKHVDQILLRIISGEPVEIKTLYQNSATDVVAARLISHGNLTPDTGDTTSAMSDRTIVLRTTDDAVRKNGDGSSGIINRVPDFYRERLLPEAPGIYNRLVQAYTRLLARKEFDPPTYSQRVTEEMRQGANSISAWVAAVCEKVEDPKDFSLSSDLFMEYVEWAQAAQFRPSNVITWGKQMTAIGYPTIRRRLPGGIRNVRALKVSNPMKLY